MVLNYCFTASAPREKRLGCQPPQSDGYGENPGAGTRIGRVPMLTQPPVIDANEIADKGYIDRRAVLERRASLVETLSGDDPEAVPIP